MPGGHPQPVMRHCTAAGAVGGFPWNALTLVMIDSNWIADGPLLPCLECGVLTEPV